MATALIIFALSLGAGVSRLTVVLAGIAITTVFGAGMNTILIVDPDAYVGSSTFLVGGLSGVLMRDLGWPAVYQQHEQSRAGIHADDVGTRKRVVERCLDKRAGGGEGRGALRQPLRAARAQLERPLPVR